MTVDMLEMLETRIRKQPWADPSFGTAFYVIWMERTCIRATLSRKKDGVLMNI